MHIVAPTTMQMGSKLQKQALQVLPSAKRTIQENSQAIKTKTRGRPTSNPKINKIPKKRIQPTNRIDEPVSNVHAATNKQHIDPVPTSAPQIGLSGRGRRSHNDAPERRIWKTGNGHGKEPQSSTLKACLLNARSIMNKISELRAWLSVTTIDLVLITESWTANHIQDSELQIPGYSFLREDRKESRGGGCLLYYKKNLRVSQTTAFNNKPEFKNINLLWFQIHLKGKDLTVGLIYNSPQATVQEREAMLQQIDAACQKSTHTIICGDFNFPKINWEQLSADSHGQPFLDCAARNYLKQHVTVPTRGKNILDLVLSTPAVQIEDTHIDCPIGSSDHSMIKFEIRSPDLEYNWQTLFLNYKKGKYRQLRQYLNKMDWDQEFRGQETNGMWTTFLSKLKNAINKYIPKSQRSAKPKPRWMTSQVKIAIDRKKKMWEKYKATQSTSDHDIYIQTLNATSKTIRKAKRIMEKRIADNIKVDPKAFYQYAKEKMKYKDEVPRLRNKNGRLTTNDKEATTLLNKYFSTVFTKEQQIMEDTLPTILPPEHPSELPKITKDTVERLLMKLNEGKSAGGDNIPPMVLKKAARAISYPLMVIFNNSLQSGQVPLDWKIANVTPIHKKGSKKDPENYRPISLTSQVCRVFERILKEELTCYLETNGLIKDSQHGFIRGKSCLTNLLMYTEKITSNIDNKIPVDVVYLDFSKAFDTVPHQRLITKLRSIRVHDTMIKWIENWLLGRKQRVVLRGTTSAWLPVTSGVPQGLVLGPLLFLIYINDMDQEVNSHLLKFADDTKIFRPIKTADDQQTLQEDLDKLCQWAQKWQMKFNTSKCKVIHFGRNNQHLPYQMDGIELQQSENERDLGVIVQQNLDVGQHIGAVTGKANQILGMIARSYDDKRRKNIIQLYKTLVRPILEYASPIWRPYKQKHVDVLESIQRRATKMIEGLGEMAYTDRLTNCRLLSLEMRRRRADLIETFKIMNGLEPLPAELFFDTISHTTTTRGHSKKLHKPQARIDPRKYSFSHRVIETWNSLSEEVISSTSVNEFKSRIAPTFNQHRDLVRSQRWQPVPVPTTSRHH